MANKIVNVFQTDSEIVNKAFKKDNYLIEVDNSKPKEYCAIYFSSNYIYFPNDSESFEKSIINKDRYEWTNMKLDNVYKHIFIRDIKKQWYLGGINNDLNSPKGLHQFLKKETEGFKTILVGSSAGGYAAVLYGQLLNSKRVYCFNGQFEISSLLKTSSEAIDPLIFRNRDNQLLLPYYDLKKFIKDSKSIYYFVSTKSAWDQTQYKHIKDVKLNFIYFNTSHHGVPFPKIALIKVFAMGKTDLDGLVNKTFNPIYFSIKLTGLIRTFIFLFEAVWSKYVIKK